MIAYGVLAGFFFFLWAAVGIYDLLNADQTGDKDLHGEKLMKQGSVDLSSRGGSNAFIVEEPTKV